MRYGVRTSHDDKCINHLSISDRRGEIDDSDGDQVRFCFVRFLILPSNYPIRSLDIPQDVICHVHDLSRVGIVPKKTTIHL